MMWLDKRDPTVKEGGVGGRRAMWMGYRSLSQVPPGE